MGVKKDYFDTQPPAYEQCSNVTPLEGAAALDIGPIMKGPLNDPAAEPEVVTPIEDTTSMPSRSIQANENVNETGQPGRSRSDNNETRAQAHKEENKPVDVVILENDYVSSNL